jgi:hypothetical protein
MQRITQDIAAGGCFTSRCDELHSHSTSYVKLTLTVAVKFCRARVWRRWNEIDNLMRWRSRVLVLVCLILWSLNEIKHRRLGLGWRGNSAPAGRREAEFGSYPHHDLGLPVGD